MAQHYALPALDTAQLAQRYDDSAPVWQSTIARLGYDRSYTRLFTTLQNKNALSITDNSRVLDVGIGSGALVKSLAQVSNTHPQIHGVDISDKMLDESARQLQGYHPTLRQASVTSLPYPDNHFDMVMTAHVLEHLPNATVGVAEMLRVLKRNGKLLVLMTRQGLWGQWIRQKWGITPVTQRGLLSLLRSNSAHHATLVPFGTWSWKRFATVVAIATK